MFLIKVLDKFEPRKSADEEPKPILKIVGCTSKPSILHKIAVLNQKWKDQGSAGKAFITEEVPVLSSKKIDEIYQSFHEYETC